MNMNEHNEMGISADVSALNLSSPSNGSPSGMSDDEDAVANSTGRCDGAQNAYHASGAASRNAGLVGPGGEGPASTPSANLASIGDQNLDVISRMQKKSGGVQDEDTFSLSQRSRINSSSYFVPKVSMAKLNCDDV